MNRPACAVRHGRVVISRIRSDSRIAALSAHGRAEAAAEGMTPRQVVAADLVHSIPPWSRWRSLAEIARIATHHRWDKPAADSRRPR
jgi:hypothetical protein